MNIRLFTTLLIMLSIKPVYALLPADANLSIDAGSSFGVEIDFWSDTPIVGHNGINLGTIQLATGAHSGFPDGSESPDIDEPWDLLAQTGMHQSNTPVNVLSDDGAGNVLLDFSGWGMTIWTDPNIDLGSGVDAGIASMTCSSDCSHGDSYTLSYLATVPVDEPSIFMGFDYRLNLVGTITDAAQSAGPLPVNTLLTIEPGTAGDDLCVSGIGSCFYLENQAGIIPTFVIEPGTDGGMIIGKSQASGGQEQGPSDANATPGEMNAAWLLFGAYATFSTLPGDASSNIFHSESCAGIDCMGKTEINAFYAAWNGEWLDMSGGEARSWTIAPDGNGGDTYYLNYAGTVASGSFQGIDYNIHLRGEVVPPSPNNPPVVNDLSISGIDTINWTPDFTDDQGDTHVCAIVTSASNGLATVNSDCTGGTYTGGAGFMGQDSFTYSVTDQTGLSATGTVNITYLGSCLVAITCPTTCEDDYPITQVITTGGGQSASVNATVQTSFIGHITTEAGLATGGRNAVRICPGTTVDFEVTSSAGDASCIINNAATASTGTLAIGDKMICTNKPEGNDTDRFSIRNGY